MTVTDKAANGRGQCIERCLRIPTQVHAYIYCSNGIVFFPLRYAPFAQSVSALYAVTAFRICAVSNECGSLC